MKYLFWIACTLVCIRVTAQEQTVSPSPAEVRVAPGGDVAFQVVYTTTDAVAECRGLTLRLHYDSSRVAFTRLDNLFPAALQPNMPVDQADTDDLDGNPSTDRLVLVIWFTTGNDWPGSLPVTLYDAHFQASGTVDGSVLGFSADPDLSNGYGFSGGTVTVSLLLPGIEVSPTAGLITGEDGSSADFQVHLLAPPADTVTIAVGSDTPAEGLCNVASLSFTPADYAVPQTVTVTGVDDAVVDGDVAYMVVLDPATSNDPAYHGLDPADVAVTNRDDDGVSGPGLAAAVDLSGKPGTQMVVPLTVDGVTGLDVTGFDLRLDYDPTLLTYAGLVTSGTLSAGWTVLANTQTPGTVRVGGISTQALTGNGTLVGVAFTVAGDAVDGTCSVLPLHDVLFNNAAVPTMDGGFCVFSCIKGDADGDGEVTVADAAIALRGSVGLPTPYDPLPLYCLDADCDGNLLAHDASLILRVALALDAGFCLPPLDAAGPPVAVRTAHRALVGGEPFSLPVTVSALSAGDQVYSYQFDLVFDPTLVQIDGIDIEGTLSQGWNVAVNDTVPGRLIVAAINPSALEGEGVLFRLRGRAQQAEGSAWLTWDRFLFTTGSPVADTVAGTLDISRNVAPADASLALLCEVGRTSLAYQPRVWDANPGDRHVFEPTSAAEWGTVTCDGTAFTYTANGGVVGPDRFSYRVTDAGGLTLERQAHVLVADGAFFDAMAAWPETSVADLSGQVSLLANQPAFVDKLPRSPRAPARAAGDRNGVVSAAAGPYEAAYAQVERAHLLADAGDLKAARALLEQVAAAPAPDQAWLGVSALVALDRMSGDPARALGHTAALTERRPELAGLMQIWDGDTLVLAGEADLAESLYLNVLDQEGDTVVDGRSLGVTATRQLVRLWASEGAYTDAAALLRRMVGAYGREVQPELELARALLLEAMGAGRLEALPLARLLHEGAVSDTVITIAADVPVGDPVVLAGLSGFRFALGAADVALLSPAGKDVKAAGSLAACVVTTASDGFQVPLVDTRGTGWAWMDAIGGGRYHPGFDINTGNWGDADCGTAFKAAARGCVRDAGTADWGSAVVEHYYSPDPWYSQYGHADTVYFSTGAAISRGAVLGLVGNEGTEYCHLHHELREADHPAPTDAAYYSNLTLSNVGNWYQDPTLFEAAHRSYRTVRWVDEGAFATTGSWTRINGVGDRNDMMYALSDSGSAARATHGFQPTRSGTYEVWVFIPYNHGTSRAAPYRILRGSTPVLQGTIDQLSYSDGWVKLGNAYLSTSYAYTLEVSAGTGESGRKIAVDDFLLILP